MSRNGDRFQRALDPYRDKTLARDKQPQDYIRRSFSSASLASVPRVPSESRQLSSTSRGQLESRQLGSTSRDQLERRQLGSTSRGQLERRQLGSTNERTRDERMDSRISSRDNLVGKELGNYGIIKHLGSGGFGSVYLGENVRVPSDRVAIKVLHMSEQVDKNDLQREATILVNLKHDNIVNYRTYGIDKDQAYLVMDYVPYGTLEGQISQKGPLPSKQVAQYVTEIANGLNYMHERELIHQDVKPANVLMGDRGCLVSDFGITRVFEKGFGLYGGTIPYMAPEQIINRPCPASDQYALGVLTYECLSSRLPFDANSAKGIIDGHLYYDPPSLSNNPNIPGGISRKIEDVVFRALKKKPEERYANVKEFAIALEQACSEPRKNRWF